MENSVEARKELLWWKENLTLCSGRSLISAPPQIIISSDATLQRWGASCHGLTTGGAMVHGGTKVSHKCLGAQGSQISYNVLHIKGKGCNVSSNPPGQYDNPVILMKMGRTKNQELTVINKEI